MDDRAGVVVDVAVTTGEVNEGTQLIAQIERVEAVTEVEVETATADAAYAHSANYQQLEGRGTDAVIPPQREPRKPKRIPASRFKYDAKHHVVRCPGGKRLERKGRCKSSAGWYYRARACDCRACPLRPRCFGQHANARTIVIVDGYEALLRARGRWRRKDEGLRRLYGRHRWRAEGAHAEGKTSTKTLPKTRLFRQPQCPRFHGLRARLGGVGALICFVGAVRLGGLHCAVEEGCVARGSSAGVGSVGLCR